MEYQSFIREAPFNLEFRKYFSTIRIRLTEQLISSYSSVKIRKFSSGLCWSYSGISTNTLAHSVNGNRRIGYNVAVWNCRKGLVKSNKSPSTKMTDIQSYLENHQLDLFGIVESDLHAATSRIYRANPLSTMDINSNLQIPGYRIILPQSWYTHGQARVIIFTKEGIKIKERKLRNEDSDLPSISLELGIGREKRTCFNIFYREFTGGISGLKDTNSQK